MIRGCTLARHYRNMLAEDAAYGFQINGIPTGLDVSLKQALLSDCWDVVTLQQASHPAPRYETWQPYLSELATVTAVCSCASVRASLSPAAL